MPKILLPPKEGASLAQCSGRKAPVARGSYYEFEVSNEEFKFWKSLTNEEREKLRIEAYDRCFHEALKEYMDSHAKRTISPFTS